MFFVPLPTSNIHCMDKRQGNCPVDCFLQCYQHALDKWMWLITTKRIESIVETTQSNSIEGQPNHIRRNIDLIMGIKLPPPRHHLFGNFEHHREIIGHGPHAESGH